jgi:cell division septation protein DedD
VFRLNTGSENAAVETADSGDAMAIAREGGVYLPAVLRIEWRTRSADGKPYPVPVLQIGLSMRDIAQGALPAGPSGLLAQLQNPATRERRAITGGEAVPVSPAAEPEPDPATPPDHSAGAQRIYGLACEASTREDVEALVDRARETGCGGEHVCVNRDGDVWEELPSALRALWRGLPTAGADAA